jgi:hypothetical protein
MKKILKLFGVLTLLGSIAAGGYFFLRFRSRRPQVELYFDDGSMLALPGSASEATPFIVAASEILEASPVSS